MKIKILAFGIAKDIFGGPSVCLELANDSTVYNLQYALEQQFPRLEQLRSYMLAVNNEYALPGDTIHERDEIAVIPPVSGG
jgi:molybdopterin synthase sulfur carrier subunit